MDKKILGVRGFNVLLILLIASQLTLLVATSVFFIYPNVKTQLEMTSVLGFVGMLFVSLPISIYIVITRKDNLNRRIFGALAITTFSWIVSGIIWYILPASFNLSILVPAGMFFMALSYIPLIIVLYGMYSEHRNDLPQIVNILIFYLNAIFIITIVYFVMTSLMADSSKGYDVIIYTLSMIGDIFILTFSTMLILINLPTERRYVYTIVFIPYFFSFIGDSLKMLENLSFVVPSGYTQYFFDAMLISLTILLIVYVLSKTTTTTIEEVNKKLEDTTLVVDDLITQSPEAIGMCAIDGTIIKANEEFLKILFLNGEMPGHKINIFKYDFNFDQDIGHMFEKLRNGETLLIDCIKIKKDDNERYLSLKIYPTFSSDRHITNYIFNAEDITERKHSEFLLKNAYDILEEKVRERTKELSVLNDALQTEITEHKKDEERIKASLKEKEILLKEIHHRVKNNMQIISSMLELQSGSIKDRRFNELMRDSQNRIKSMALIHESLYRSENMANVDFSEYLNSLVNNIYLSYRSSHGQIKMAIEVEKISLNIDTAIPLGLIMNELITNTFKHAFPDQADGEIKVKLMTLVENRYRLVVQDNGIGFPEGFSYENTQTLGISMVNMLVEQIEGTMQINNDHGICITIEIPMV